MTYNILFDFYFTAKWLAIGLPFLIILMAVISFKIFNSASIIVRSFIISLFPIAFLLLLTAAIFNPIYLGFGRPDGILSLHSTDRNLIVIDYILSAGGKSTRGIKYFRVHLIDPISGEKKIRFVVGQHKEFVGTLADTIVLASSQDISYYLLNSGKEILIYNKETLPNLFSQLSSGVESIDWRWGSLYITSLDGKKWIIDPITKKCNLENSFQTPFLPTNKLYLHGNEILYDDKPGGSDRFELKGLNGNENIKYITADNKVLDESLSFIGGNLVALSAKEDLMIIQHYPSLDKKEFIYTAVSLDGKTKLWEFRSSKLDPEISSISITSSIAMNEEKAIIFLSFRKEIICLKLGSGEILWRNKL